MSAYTVMMPAIENPAFFKAFERAQDSGKKGRNTRSPRLMA
jgi:hypothetical protein